MIYETTPYAKDKRYGRALNAFIEMLPDDAWVCVRDRDTMYLTHDSGNIMLEAIQDKPDVALFTCATNRVWGKPLSPEPDILKHVKIAKDRAKVKRYTHCGPIVPAFFWLFPKSTWNKVKFDDHPILSPPNNPNSFDVRWSRQVAGKKVCIEHLYLFHLYRLDRKQSDIHHLVTK